jgi:hypothetical protein
MTPEEHAIARQKYADACQRITTARQAGRHAEAARIARSILDLEDALNAYDAEQTRLAAEIETGGKA